MKTRYFTLIEILASMVIIMILIGLVMGGSSLAVKIAKENRCKAQIAALEVILEQYKTDWFFFPEANENEIELNATWWSQNLLSPDGDSYIDNTQLGLKEDATYGYTDPYGQPFYYQSTTSGVSGLKMMNAEKFDIWSKGFDEQHGEAGTDDDTNSTVDDAFDAKTVKSKYTDDITNWGQN